MINEKLLREIIKKKGFKMEYIAKELGLTTAGLRKKVSNETEFKISEAYKLADILGIKGNILESKIFLPNSDT